MFYIYCDHNIIFWSYCPQPNITNWHSGKTACIILSKSDVEPVELMPNPQQSQFGVFWGIFRNRWATWSIKQSDSCQMWADDGQVVSFNAETDKQRIGLWPLTFLLSIAIWNPSEHAAIQNQYRDWLKTQRGHYCKRVPFKTSSS